MKVRVGFVSNSSSSSFVCDNCGDSESGWDATYQDVGFCCCEQGHEICSGCMVGERARINDVLKESNWHEGVDSEICPICNLYSLSSSLEIKYLHKLLGFSNGKEVIQQVRERFGTFDKFIEFLNEK